MEGGYLPGTWPPRASEQERGCSGLGEGASTMPWGGLGPGKGLLTDKGPSEHEAGTLSFLAREILTLSRLVTLAKDCLFHASVFPPIQRG